ncbi:MAG: hypothetical protein ACYTBJ_00570 [Planctomycetota bacterium]|jgi:hypothetical protein
MALFKPKEEEFDLYNDRPALPPTFAASAVAFVGGMPDPDTYLWANKERCSKCNGVVGKCGHTTVQPDEDDHAGPLLRDIDL